MKLIKLFDFWGDYDFGNDFYLILGQFSKFNVLDLEVHTTEYWCWEPNISLTFEILAGALFSIRFSILAFSFDINLIHYHYPMTLKHVRE